MVVWKSRISLARRSIRNIWLKELHYFRANHPLFILIFILIFLTFYNIGWNGLPKKHEEHYEEMKIFDNFRLVQHKFVKMMICIPTDVVDYRFSTVNEAIPLIKLENPDVHFVKDLNLAKHALSRGDVDILILFTKLIETGKRIEYSIISKHGDLNKHYCVHCDDDRRRTWQMAIEAQQVTNRFLYWVVKSRGQISKGPYWQLSHVYVRGDQTDPMYSKRQTDLFIIWLILLPICARLIDSWNDDRKSGIYKTLLDLGCRRYEYYLAKFNLWYGIALIVTLLVFVVNVSVVPPSYSNTFIPFVVIYAACIISFTMFLAALFVGSPLVAKIVGLILMAAGEFGFGTIFHGLAFFQLSVRYFGKSTGNANWTDTIAVGCMTGNCCLLALLTVYLDVYHFSFGESPLPFWYPLTAGYWRPISRKAQLDEKHGEQILFREGHPRDPRKVGAQEAHKNASKKQPLTTLFGVCKQVKQQWIVNRLTLSVRAGEVLTLYGHRGCGNEHILRILAGKITPDYGEIQWENRQRELVIATATEVPLVNYLTVSMYLRMVSRLRGMELEQAQLDEMLGELGLSKVDKFLLNLLSTTQQERLRIAAAFVGEPDVVLIDWPTKESLPHYKYQILRFIEKRKLKRAIVISTYDAETTESISDRVVMLSEGFVVFNGPCEAYLRAISSVFEIRLWPITGFNTDQIAAMISILTMNDPRMKRDVKWFETPNGKLRVTFPIGYRRRIPNALRELEKHAEQFEIAFSELSTPNIHDVYSNACYNEKQYAMLASFEDYQKYYAQQKPMSRTMSIFKNLIRVFKDRHLICHVIGVVGLFVLFGLLTLFWYQRMHDHHTLEVSLNTHDYPITIFCEQCHHEPSKNVKYVKQYGKRHIGENSARFLWRENTLRAEKELIAKSRGDDTFTMIIQNFAISQIIEKLTGNYPSIQLSLESNDYRETGNGVSWILNDVNTNQAAMILTESYPLMYFLGICQTFIAAVSVLLPLRLVEVNMGPDNLLFPWPRYLYFGFIFLVNLLIFLILAITLTSLMILIGFFAVNPAGCFFRLLFCWLAVYVTTLPFIYGLVFAVSNTSAVLPTVIAASAVLVNLPLLVSSYSAENAISLKALLRFVSWTSMVSPPTALQVLAAFLNAGEFHEENRGTINALTVACFVHLWILLVFAVAVFQPGFSRIREYLFIASTALHSNFERGTTLPPSALIRNTFVYGKNDNTTGGKTTATERAMADVEPAMLDQRPNGGKEAEKKAPPVKGGKAGSNETETTKSRDSNRRVHPERSSTIADMQKHMAQKRQLVQEPPRPLFRPPREPTEMKVCIPVSLMTCYEEKLVRKTVTMKHWAHKQEIPVDNSSIYLLGDHAGIKSVLLRTVAEMNPSELIAYVPAVECLPTIYTTRQLLVNVAACHGVEIPEEFIKYLLYVFDMEHLVDVSIKWLADSERRILMLLSKLIMNPSILIFDQLDTHLPHPRMMTVWSLCARLRHEGVGVLFSSLQNGFAEHTATSCAHMHKGTIHAAEAPSSLKAERRCLIMDIVPMPGVKIETLAKMIEMAINDTVELPTTSRKVSIRLQGDDFQTMEMMIRMLGSFQKYVLRSSIRSISFDEYIACAFESTVVKKHEEQQHNISPRIALAQNGASNQ